MRQTEDLPRWLFLFGFAYAFMHIIPVFFTVEIENRLTWGDILAILTPLVVVFTAWKLFSILSSAVDFIRLTAVFWLMLAASLLYAGGQGMNLAANAIARHLADQGMTPIFQLTYFFDERLGHILWHIGMVGMTAALLLRSQSLQGSHSKALCLLGSLSFAFAYFTDAVEGQTVFLLLPAAMVIVIWMGFRSFRARDSIAKNPVNRFFLTGYAIALLLFLIWRIWQGGFPEFSELGWI